MTNKQKYDKVFIGTFSIGEESLSQNPEYNQIKGWDSIGHMAMVSEIEEAFGIMMETDDIINFNSYKKGFDLLAKYGVEF